MRGTLAKKIRRAVAQTHPHTTEERLYFHDTRHLRDSEGQIVALKGSRRLAPSCRRHWYQEAKRRMDARRLLKNH